MTKTGPGVHMLEKYELCRVCYSTWVKRTYAKNHYRPLCKECSALITKVTVPILDNGGNCIYDSRSTMQTKTRSRTPEEVDQYIKHHQVRKPKEAQA